MARGVNYHSYSLRDSGGSQSQQGSPAGGLFDEIDQRVVTLRRHPPGMAQRGLDQHSNRVVGMGAWLHRQAVPCIQRIRATLKLYLIYSFNDISFLACDHAGSVPVKTAMSHPTNNDRLTAAAKLKARFARLVAKHERTGAALAHRPPRRTSSGLCLLRRFEQKGRGKEMPRGFRSRAGGPDTPTDPAGARARHSAGMRGAGIVGRLAEPADEAPREPSSPVCYLGEFEDW